VSSTNDIKHQLSLYPNPATDELNVQATQEGVLSITDIRGVVLHKAVIGADKSVRISTKDLAAGQYILTLKSDTVEVRKLFIKQ
jgi:thymidine phosphorylase